MTPPTLRALYLVAAGEYVDEIASHARCAVFAARDLTVTLWLALRAGASPARVEPRRRADDAPMTGPRGDA